MDLAHKRCQACEGHETPLSLAEANAYLEQVPAWQLDETEHRIYREFAFKNFKRAMFFVNAVAYLAEQEGHHPDIGISYNKVTLSLTTHAINGLSENDFIMAAQIDTLVSEE